MSQALRIVKVLRQQNLEVCRMADLKKGEIFSLQDDVDSELWYWKAIEDGIVKDGIGAIEAVPLSVLPNFFNDNVSNV